jgi:hypothetical protein
MLTETVVRARCWQPARNFFVAIPIDNRALYRKRNPIWILLLYIFEEQRSVSHYTSYGD